MGLVQLLHYWIKRWLKKRKSHAMLMLMVMMVAVSGCVDIVTINPNPRPPWNTRSNQAAREGIGTMGRWLLGVVVIGAVAAVSHQDFDRADQQTRRMPPAAFVQLPDAIRSDLENRECTIPQPYTSERPTNVVQGRFTSADQLDWAVLCSRRRASSILVFRGGGISTVDEIASEPDRKSLQTIDGDGTIGYSREITAVDAKYILDHCETFGGPKPPPLDHQGINDMFISKASIVGTATETIGCPFPALIDPGGLTCARS